MDVETLKKEFYIENDDDIKILVHCLVDGSM